jgi:hypothetical protein
MNSPQVHTPGNVFSRILLIYGLYTFLSNAAFLIGYQKDSCVEVRRRPQVKW